MLRLLLLIVCLFSAASYLLGHAYRHSEFVSRCGIGLVLLIIFLAFVIRDDIRQRRRLRASEVFLTKLACPVCGDVFGAELAHKVMNAPPVPKLPSTQLTCSDDFGMSIFACDGCKKVFCIIETFPASSGERTEVKSSGFARGETRKTLIRVLSERLPPAGDRLESVCAKWTPLGACLLGE